GRIKQVMYNLLSNAVKFTENGGSVAVDAKAAGSELIVSVTDTGIGIAAEGLQRVFEEVYQGDRAFTRRPEGTGLGLGLGQRLVALHGGSIEVESEPGKGSVFRFRIPDGIVAAEEEHAQAAAPDDGPPGGGGYAGTRGIVMVVEDNPTNMRLTKSILTSQG